uniref:Uncharacterized protein n=1 Tax=Arundo donax TaxID=35708 RepID=A0A0A9DSL6_ARUDO
MTTSISSINFRTAFSILGWRIWLVIPVGPSTGTSSFPDDSTDSLFKSYCLSLHTDANFSISEKSSIKLISDTLVLLLECAASFSFLKCSSSDNKADAHEPEQLTLSSLQPSSEIDERGFSTPGGLTFTNSAAVRPLDNSSSWASTWETLEVVRASIVREN